MGRPKDKLRLQKLSLLQHVQAAAEATGWQVRIIRRDIVKRCGPIGGIFTGLKSSRAHAEVFLACDMPFVSRELIVKLASALGRHRAACVKDGGIGFPLVLRVDSIDFVQQQIVKGEFSVRELAKLLKAKVLKMSVRGKSQTLNINTREELETARKHLRKARGHTGLTCKRKP
jgi:molybdopterin-guanine dinucleotide biosynthesis protein A